MCSRKDCHLPAVKYPVLLVKPEVWVTPPARVEISSLAVCESCAGKMGLKDIFTDVSWPHIAAGFTVQGLQAPNPALTELAFEYLV